ncbi:hypothetical protein D3C87_739400 [compost metagenome]
MGLRLHEGQLLLHQQAEIGFPGDQFERSGFQPCEIEHVVDDPLEALRSLLNLGDEASLIRAKRPADFVLEEFGIARDRRQGRAKLVRG